jgi:hypothetical protein
VEEEEWQQEEHLEKEEPYLSDCQVHHEVCRFVAFLLEFHTECIILRHSIRREEATVGKSAGTDAEVGTGARDIAPCKGTCGTRGGEGMMQNNNFSDIIYSRYRPQT